MDRMTDKKDGRTREKKRTDKTDGWTRQDRQKDRQIRQI